METNIDRSRRPAFWRDMGKGDHACQVYGGEGELLDTLSQALTPVVERPRGAGRAVRAFGGMVALLWSSGQYAARRSVQNAHSSLIHT